MNKKIKMIELLNIIANEEEVPKRIKVKDYNFIWKISEKGTGYYNEKEGTGYYWLEDYISLDNVGDLNTKVEILEDNTEEIEELDRSLKFDDLIEPYGKNEDMMWTEIIKQHNKIDEIIRYVKRKDKNND